ncbi:hypothetical protein FIBSPDRAFT_452324 [Athelia psychrophila]|uniref:Uncharacterized protein n=1 Tax=Athelia psychrophila TaxID=1759441 RepID=A0A166M4Z2_9AGAM|nr:hypothetical protein FIBSPDRAFT_452324 [Fibularhizoctonia sp. CBS 109695]
MMTGSDLQTRVYPSLSVTMFTTGTDALPYSSECTTIPPIRTTSMTDSLGSAGGSVALPAVPPHLTPDWHHFPDSHDDKSSDSYPLLDMSILTTGTGGAGATVSHNVTGSSSPGGRASMMPALPTDLATNQHHLPDKHV